MISVTGRFINFCRNMQNSAVKGKFDGSARNSTVCRKLWALPITTVKSRLFTLLWPPCVADADIIFSSVVSSFFFFFFSPNLSGRRLDVYHTYVHTWCGLSANLECRSEMCCARLAAGRKSRQKSPSRHHRTTFSGYIVATKAHIDNRRKLVKQQYVLHMSHNMVNFGPLAAEIFG